MATVTAAVASAAAVATTARASTATAGPSTASSAVATTISAAIARRCWLWCRINPIEVWFVTFLELGSAFEG